jgi:hypothetical protein
MAYLENLAKFFREDDSDFVIILMAKIMVKLYQLLVKNNAYILIICLAKNINIILKMI